MTSSLWIFSHKNTNYAFDFNNWYRPISLQVLTNTYIEFLTSCMWAEEKYLKTITAQGHKLMHFLSSKEWETARGKPHFCDRIKFIGSRVSMQVSYQVHSEDMNSLVWCWDSLFKSCLLAKSKKIMAVAKAKPRTVLHESLNPSPPRRYLECYFNHGASVAKVAPPLNTESMLFSGFPALCWKSNLTGGAILHSASEKPEGFTAQDSMDQSRSSLISCYQRFALVSSLKTASQNLIQSICSQERLRASTELGIASAIPLYDCFEGKLFGFL